MKGCVVIFSGDRLDEYGMPIPWNCYFIFAQLDKNTHKYLVRIIPYAQDTPEPGSPCLAGKDAIKDTINNLIRKLELIPKNKGLRKEVYEVSASWNP